MKTKLMLSAVLAGLLVGCAAPAPVDDHAENLTDDVDVFEEKEELAPKPDAVDYSALKTWLCHPDKKDSDDCAVDLTTTVVHAGNEPPLTEVMDFVPAEAPDVDCFYVYPTVSTDPTGNSDMTPDEAEKRVVNVQFARFAEVCRLYAPAYRQVTLAGLRARMAGQTDVFDEPMAYQDVKAAWEHYLKHENNGRGVILVGHSQGARMIQFLLKNDILGQPVQKQIISAMPIGYTYETDRGASDYEGMPLCSDKSQTGCLISYVTFRNDSPPPPTSWFGLASAEDKQAVCVNPAALTGVDELTPYLSNVPDPSGRAPKFAGDEAEVTTPFATLPGLLTARCVDTGKHAYLEVTTNADPADPRTDWVAGDVYYGPQIAKDWGLHLGDMHLAMGNLIDIAKAQSDAWLAEQSAE